MVYRSSKKVFMLFLWSKNLRMLFEKKLLNPKRLKVVQKLKNWHKETELQKAA